MPTEKCPRKHEVCAAAITEITELQEQLKRANRYAELYHYMLECVKEAGFSSITEALVAITEIKAQLAEGKKDTGRLNHLQNGSTVTLVFNKQPNDANHYFRIGGVYSSDSLCIRTAIDTAMSITEQTKGA